MLPFHELRQRMKIQAEIKKAAVAVLAAASVLSSGAKTKVTFFFDTEDFIQPRSADAIRDIANILASEGVRGHFAMVGYLGKKLVDWRRVDVLDALKPHLVGTQTLYHALHPNITESTDIEDYGKAREIAFDEECRAIGMLQAATGKDRMWCSVLPGNGNTIVAMYLYADLGIPFFGGGTGMYEDETKCGDVWYCNQRHLNYAYNLHLESFLPGRSNSLNVDAALDALARQKVATLYMHPHMAVCTQHWDWVFKRGNNYPFGEWPFAQARDPADTAVFYERLKAFIRVIKADPRFEITDLEQMSRALKPRRTISRSDIPAIRKTLLADFNTIRDPASWSVADVFQAAVRFLRGEGEKAPGKVYGFLERPRGVTAEVSVSAADLKAAAANIDLGTFLPPSFEVGGKRIGPADFLFAALEVLETGASEVKVTPREQLGSFKEVPSLEQMKIAGSWVHTKAFKDEFLSERLRLQLWTLRLE